MTESQKEYYSNSAFDSTNLRDVSMPRPEEKTFRTRIKGDYNLVRGAQCREYLGDLSFEDTLEDLKGGSDEYDETESIEGEQTQLPHEVFYHIGIDSRTVVSGIRLLLGVFLIPAVPGTLYSFYMDGLRRAMEVGGYLTLCIAAGYCFCGFLLTSGKVRYKIRTVFLRRTGKMRHFNKNRLLETREWIELPFDELDPVVNMRANHTGMSHDLSIIHRGSKAILFFGTLVMPAGLWCIWDKLQQFMDISKPLPDVPEYESYRHLDPVTAAYDKKWGRPKDFWKNLDTEIAIEMGSISNKAANNFPWGHTLEEALAAGWQPSPFNDDNIKYWYTRADKLEQFRPLKTENPKGNSVELLGNCSNCGNSVIHAKIKLPTCPICKHDLAPTTESPNSAIASASRDAI